jgi:uncharacterized protein
MTESPLIEQVLAFDCEGARLWGILTRPPAGASAPRIAVLVVVGGPQYRVGSHRQFVLLSRALARRGFPSFRFDYRGMGDSEGSARSFEGAGPDLRAALDALCAACPQAGRVVVWGLCDAASAALMFATADERVVGVVAVNPWARSAASLSATRVKHYYAARLVQREFWSKLLFGGVNLRASLGSFFGDLRAARGSRRSSPTQRGDDSFQTKMARGLRRFRGRVLLILSSNDLTASEFVQYTDSAVAWRGLLADPKVTRINVAEADHTFSRRIWQDQVENETSTWLAGLSDAMQTPETKNQ